MNTDDPKYQKVLPDFNYFRNVDQFEDEIQNNMVGNG